MKTYECVEYESCIENLKVDKQEYNRHSLTVFFTVQNSKPF